MTPARFSADFHSIVNDLTEEGFSKAKTSMSFIHQGEVFFLSDKLNVFSAEFSNLISSGSDCIIFSYPLDNFLLL
jgi:hypothetical protein